MDCRYRSLCVILALAGFCLFGGCADHDTDEDIPIPAATPNGPLPYGPSDDPIEDSILTIPGIGDTNTIMPIIGRVFEKPLSSYVTARQTHSSQSSF